MIAPLLALLARAGAVTGASGLAAKIIGGVMAFAALVAIGGLGVGGVKIWFWLHDRKVIQQHTDAVNVRVLEHQVQAERKAGAAFDADRAAAAQQQQTLKEKAHDAHVHRRSALDAVANEL